MGHPTSDHTADYQALPAEKKDQLGKHWDTVFGEADAPQIAKAATGLSGENTLILPLEQFGDVIAKEVTRLNKEVQALEGEQTRIAGQLGNEGFVAKAPQQVVDKLRARQDEIVGQLATARQQLAKWQ